MRKKDRESKSSEHFIIPPGRILCYVTGKLRDDKPEEHIRQRWARSLVEEYGYKKQDLDIQLLVRMGRAKKYADIAIFLEGQEHKQENVFILVEAKPANVKPADKKIGIDQLHSYMAACLNCRFGLWVGESREAFEKIAIDNKAAINAIYDIPRHGEEEIEQPSFEKLVPAHDLKDALKRCHNYISGNQGLGKDEAFHELLKVIFCKVRDERQSGTNLRFYIRNKERKSVSGQHILANERIIPLFEEVKQRYPYIFKQDDSIILLLQVLAYVVAEFQRYSFLKTDTDIKGEAYEELVGGNLRGDRGEFFTPRDVCDMAVKMTFATFPNDKLTKIKILDPACGTGGFLVTIMNIWKLIFYTEELDKWGDDQKALDEVGQRLRECCDDNLYGIDIRPLLVRAAQMNLVMHGNGSMNVMAANSLKAPGEWPRETEQERRLSNRIQLGLYDVVFTNPPFGSKIPVDDPHILSQYELSRVESLKPRTSMPPEQVFVERCIQFLKPGGRLAIVLPDSILNNPGLMFIRKWLLINTRIIASIDLPVETFAKFGGARNTSVLIMQKKYPYEISAEAAGAKQEYLMFTANPRKIGYDLRGEPVYLRTPSGEEILDPETKQLIRDRHLPIVTERFEEWISAHKHEVIKDE